MALLPPSEIHTVNGITGKQKLLIRAYLQGAVYSWVKNRPRRRFTASDIIWCHDWEGTPLYALYGKHISSGKSHCEAIDSANKDAAWILKSVLADDRLYFNVSRRGLRNAYSYSKNGPQDS